MTHGTNSQRSTPPATTTCGSDPYVVWRQIDTASQQIQLLIGQIDKLGEDAARAEADYDRAVAVALVKLKNGEQLDVFGLKVQNPPASTSERIARGLCYKEKLQTALTANALSACQQKLRAAQAILSGLQSKNRYLDVDVK